MVIRAMYCLSNAVCANVGRRLEKHKESGLGRFYVDYHTLGISASERYNSGGWTRFIENTFLSISSIDTRCVEYSILPVLLTPIPLPRALTIFQCPVSKAIEARIAGKSRV